MKKKIIHIISRMNVGGPSKIINYYHEHLHQYEFDSILICGRPAENEGEITPYQRPGVEVIYLEGLSPDASLWRSFKAFIKFLNLLRKIKPDIIHSHQAKAGVFGRLAGFILRVPKRIHTYHGHVFYGYFRPLKTKFIICIEKFLAFLSTRSIAISPEVFQDITRKYKTCKPTKTSLVNVGIDTNLFLSLPSRDSAKKHFNLPSDKFIIGFIGRLVNIKNPLAFISLAKELVKAKNDFHFVLVGDGNLKEEILQKIKHEDLEKHFTILPWITNVEQILVALDLLVMTSLNEGTPLILMEAMVVGIPIASTAVGGVPYLIEHEKTGFIISNEMANSAAYLAKKFENYEKEVLSLAPIAKEKILNNHSLEKILRQMVEIYNKKCN